VKKEVAVSIYADLRKFLTEKVALDFRHSENSMRRRNMSATIELIEALPKSHQIEEHFLVSFAWEILEGHLENLYNLDYNEKPLHLYARLILGAEFDIVTIQALDRPMYKIRLTLEDKEYVRKHYPAYSKVTCHSR
jgi:hypothetical protein